MTIEQIAFRAVLYRELHDQRYGGPGDLAEHHTEMGSQLPPGVAAALAENLGPEDWAVVRAMDEADCDKQVTTHATDLLALYDPDRLEAMYHALGTQPKMMAGWAARVLDRWGYVREAMHSFASWTVRADDLPYCLLTWREHPGGEALAAELRALVGEWPPPGQDPAVSARRFELALSRALVRVAGK